MPKLTTLIPILCWIVVSGFAAAAVAYGFYVPMVSENLWCANTVTDPLAYLLNVIAPAAACAVLGLAILYRSGAVRIWNLGSAGALYALTLAALVIGGNRWFEGHLGTHRLSEVVWWF